MSLQKTSSVEFMRKKNGINSRRKAMYSSMFPYLMKDPQKLLANEGSEISPRDRSNKELGSKSAGKLALKVIEKSSSENYFAKYMPDPGRT